MNPRSAQNIVIRDLESFDDLCQVKAANRSKTVFCCR